VFLHQWRLAADTGRAGDMRTRALARRGRLGTLDGWLRRRGRPGWALETRLALVGQTHLALVRARARRIGDTRGGRRSRNWPLRGGGLGGFGRSLTAGGGRAAGGEGIGDAAQITYRGRKGEQNHAADDADGACHQVGVAETALIRREAEADREQPDRRRNQAQE
jgi:hypothetical protein